MEGQLRMPGWGVVASAFCGWPGVVNWIKGGSRGLDFGVEESPWKLTYESKYWQDEVDGDREEVWSDYIGENELN